MKPNPSPKVMTEDVKHAITLAEKGDENLAIKALRSILSDPSDRALKYVTLAYCYELNNYYPNPYFPF